jgi:SAM-dependent MidA family methyltransferase
MPPERFDHFMARANAAYYARENPFADFTTAPELTQVFGEILGAWAKITWAMMGGTGAPCLVEAGAGSGVMMADMLRVIGDAQVHFIEISPRLRAFQAERVPNAQWHDDLAAVPDQKMILIANEFLDALPVRQFLRRNGAWVERYVENGAYVEQKADKDFGQAPEGAVREINEAAQNFVRGIAGRDAVALLIDYGPAQSGFGESVQAIRAGKYSDPLANPGSADITAHVDFASLAETARDAGADVQGPVKQNAFLTALGLHQRTDFLRRKYPHMADTLRLAAQRLTAPEAMGSLFKVLAITPAGFPILPGFEP